MAKRHKKELKYPGASRVFSKTMAFVTTMVFTPGFFLVQMVTVDFGLFHQILICYLFINLYGNMLLSIMTDTTTRAYGGDGEECAKCQLPRPTNGWHCQRCDVCIVGSNHHCTFLTHCVGRYNYRYYICFLGHFTALMTYFLCYYSYAIACNCELFALKRVLLPTHHALFLAQIYNKENDFKKYHEPMKPEDIYVLYFIINCALFICAVTLFYHHIRNVFKGATSYEYAKKLDYLGRDWRTNFVNAFGTRWYLAVLWPFVHSPLPEERQMLEYAL